jgi:UDP-glucose 4-epimerase
LGKEINPVFLPARVGDVRESLADITLARKVLGYEPVIGLEEGVLRTIDYYRQIVTQH